MGEKNQEANARDDLGLENDQKQNMQTNYSFNKVVRTPYEKEIVAPDHIPWSYIENSPHKEFLSTLTKELKAFNDKLELEK